MKRVIMLLLVLALGLATEVVKADFIIGTPISVPNVNSSADEVFANISADGLQLYFSEWEVFRPGGEGLSDIWVATRQTTSDVWGDPCNLGSTVNSSSFDDSPSISADGLTLFFSSERSGGYGAGDIWVTTRATASTPWASPVNLGSTVNSSDNDMLPNVSADGFTLFFQSDRSGGYGNEDLWMVTRQTTKDPWGEPVNLGPTVNSSSMDSTPRISADGSTLYFASNRSGGSGDVDLWMVTRQTTKDPWGEPMNLGPSVNTSSNEAGLSTSSDGSVLYFLSNRSGGSGGYDLWQAPITPIVDFNGDLIVDAADICIMIDHWGENYSLCDIGPTPIGDGIVDVQDLIVLSEHLFEDINDPTLVAHWALDEIEGMIARDSVSGNSDFVMGDPLWQPTGGKVDGAIRLDGVDDYILIAPVLNPSGGSFSIFAWVLGGAPGQVVISELMGANWLMLDVEGKLMTELKDSAGLADPLLSDTTITDGEWHRISLVWDGSNRRLCVDDVVVAEDVQDSLENSYKSIYIGTDKDREVGTFWDGLIDDVRIYNRALLP